MTSSPRRLLHVFATFGAGGPQIRALQLMRQLGSGMQHSILAMDGDTTAAAQLDPAVAARLLPAPRRTGMLGMVQQQQALLRRERPDLVLTYNWGAIETVWAARRLRLPLVHHEDGFLPEEVQQRLRRRNWLRRWLLRRVPVILPSRRLQQIALQEWRLRPELVHCLPNGVDLDRFRPVAAAGGTRLRLGTVGGLRPEKDHATLLRALLELPAAELWLVGDGKLRGQLERLAADLGLLERVHFRGAVADTAPCYAEFGIFVLSSRTEQLPLVLLEAMAAGLPVVATDVGDIAEVLPAEQREFVVPPGEPKALAAAISRLLGDPQLCSRLGQRNRRRAEQEYAAPRCLGRFCAVYQQALAAQS